MKSDTFIPKNSLALATTALLLLGTGCKDQSIQVYKIPKEQPKPVQQMADAPSPSTPHLHWDELPANWTEVAPSSMRAASLKIEGPEGTVADVGAIPLPMMAGKELDFVNLWRSDLKLPQTTTNAIAENREDAMIVGVAGYIFEMVSEELVLDDKYKKRVIVGMASLDDSTWFFKLTGPDALVASEKQHFVQWLEKLQIHEGAHGESSPKMTQAPAPSAAADWEAPAGWTPQQPGQMLLASFALPGGDAKVTVSSLGGDGGGLLANVNRWRRQLGLAPIDTPQLDGITSSIDTPDGKGTLVDIEGSSQRMLAVIIPHNGKSWFYKSMGAADIVEQERDAFVKFAQTAKR